MGLCRQATAEPQQPRHRGWGAGSGMAGGWEGDCRSQWHSFQTRPQAPTDHPGEEATGNSAQWNGRPGSEFPSHHRKLCLQGALNS